MKLSVLLVLLSWAVVAFGQPAWLPWLAPVAAVGGYALFWLGIRDVQSKVHRFLCGCLWFACVQTIQLSWMTAIEYQGPYILVIYGALCLWLGLQFGAITLFMPRRGEELRLMRILAIASMWTLMEWGRLFLLCGFSWNPTGLALTAFLPSLQFAALFGVFGLSFWVMLVNLGVFFLCSAKRSLKCYFKWTYVALLPYLFGWTHIGYHRKMEAAYPTSVSAALVQPGLLPGEKIPLSGHLHEFVPPLEQWKRICCSLKQTIVGSCDFLALPEAAIPFHSNSMLFSFEEVREMMREIFGEEIENSFPAAQTPFAAMKQKLLVSNAFIAQTLANHYGAHLVSGMDEQDSDSHLSYNAALHFSPRETTVQRYEKRVLMPLAEYLPFEWLKPLVKAYGITHFFTHGKEAKVFQGKIPFALTICYEETFPHLVREGRHKGAVLHINLTNDSWYPFSRLAQQHFDLAKIRAVENGAPLLRACNTGITAAVNSFGELLGCLGEKHEGDEGKCEVLYLTFNAYQHTTFFLLWGDKALMSLCAMTTLGFLIFRKKRSW